MVNGDSLLRDSSFTAQDSVPEDTVVFYEVPDILQPGFVNTYTRTGTARAYRRNSIHNGSDMYETMVRTSILPLYYGNGYPLHSAHLNHALRNTPLLLNGHPVSHPLWGVYDYSWVPLNHLATLLLGSDGFGEYVIDGRTKINSYTQPFSYFQFSTGAFSTNIFNIDFTRAVSNNFGLYTSGVYETSDGQWENSQHDRGSLYAHAYYSGNFKARTDILYHTNTRGFPGNELDTLTGKEEYIFSDASFMIGNDNHLVILYYTRHENLYQNHMLDEQLIRTETFAFQSEHTYSIKGLELLCRPRGQLYIIDSDAYGDYTTHDGECALALSKKFNRIVASAQNKTFIDSENNLFNTPHFTVGLQTYDSLWLSAELSRTFRIPTLPETTSNGAGYEFLPFVGNPFLEIEYCWSQNFSLHTPTTFVSLYRNVYDNLISQECDTLYNIPALTTVGIHGSTELTIPLAEDSAAQARTDITLGLTGNYIFSEDSLPYSPKQHIAALISFSRQTQRLGLRTTIQGQYYDTRFTSHGEKLDAFHTISGSLAVRVVALTLTFHADNLLNSKYSFLPNYQMPSRTFLFTVKWEFWN